MGVVTAFRTIPPTNLSCQCEAEALPELHRAHSFKRALAPCRVVPDDVAVDALLQLLKGHATPLALPEHLRLQKLRRKPSDALVVGRATLCATSTFRCRPLYRSISTSGQQQWQLQSLWIIRWLRCFSVVVKIATRSIEFAVSAFAVLDDVLLTIVLSKQPRIGLRLVLCQVFGQVKHNFFSPSPVSPCLSSDNRFEYAASYSSGD